jgi:tRNA (uracil-5-)-methyltransferase TRM9
MTDRPTRTDVKNTYEEIAAHFSKTREYPWPEVEAFVSDFESEKTGLDAGCGNGRHTELLAEVCERAIGLDVSQGLLQAARNRRTRSTVFDLMQGDATALPLEEGTIDVVVYVATLHHLPGRETRVGSLDELGRVLGADGRALVSAWSTEHDRFEATAGFDTTVEWTLPGGETVDRFYHIYDPEEFQADLDASTLSAEHLEISSGNCYARVATPE